MSVKPLDYPHGKILMEIESDPEVNWRQNSCAKEPWTIAFIEAMEPGSTFYDIGANVGPYTLVAAARGHRVVAVEPSIQNAARLEWNLALNNWLDRVLIIVGGIGAVDGWVWFQYSDLRPGAATHLWAQERPQHHHRKQVQAWAMDTALLITPQCAGPRYIKIDVDGAEMDVLSGAEETLRDPDTRGIMLEMQLAQEAQLVGFLAARGWRLAGRYDDRGGVKIPNIAYGHFLRTE